MVGRDAYLMKQNIAKKVKILEKISTLRVSFSAVTQFITKLY